jgi:hypothetical protein
MSISWDSLLARDTTPVTWISSPAALTVDTADLYCEGYQFVVTLEREEKWLYQVP